MTFNIIGEVRAFAVLIAAALALAGCGPTDPARVEARQYDSFWLWAGVRAPDYLKAREWYLLDGEILANHAAARACPSIGPFHQCLRGAAWPIERIGSNHQPDIAAWQARRPGPPWNEFAALLGKDFAI